MAKANPPGQTPAKNPGPAKKTATTVAKATPQGRAAATAAKAVQKRPAAKKPAGVAAKVPAHARKWLLAEFVVCVLLLVLSGLTGQASKDGTQTDTGSRLAVKGSALAGVFIVLGLVSAGGKGAEKAAGALGVLITLAYMFQEKDTFTSVSDWAKGASR